MNLRMKFTLLTLCSVLALTANEPKIVKLTPPLITADTVSEKIVCTRPMREGKFNISIDQIDDKTIVNCYGHGGSGWTTLFGSVNKAVELFKTTNPSRDTPIRVVGSGSMGLTTAIELTRQGYQVAGISTKSIYDNPSWRAAGYFALVSVKTSTEEQENLNQIGLNTFLTYRQIEEGQHPYISPKTVRFLPVYASVDTSTGVEDLEVKGLIPSRELVTLDFGNGVIHEDYVQFMTYFMNTSILMKELTSEVNRLNIQVEIDEIKKFGDISEEIVFNCTGLGGRELNSDENMVAVRGHLITLNEKSGQEHMNYMIYSKVVQDNQNEYVYLFPKNSSVTPNRPQGLDCFGVLGGTFIPNVDKLAAQDQEKLDRVEFKRLLDRNCQFFLGHDFETVIPRKSKA